MDPIAVALLVGLIAAALFLFARGGSSRTDVAADAADAAEAGRIDGGCDPAAGGGARVASYVTRGRFGSAGCASTRRARAQRMEVSLGARGAVGGRARPLAVVSSTRGLDVDSDHQKTGVACGPAHIKFARILNMRTT